MPYQEITESQAREVLKRVFKGQTPPAMEWITAETGRVYCAIEGGKSAHLLSGRNDPYYNAARQNGRRSVGGTNSTTGISAISMAVANWSVDWSTDGHYRDRRAAEVEIIVNQVRNRHEYKFPGWSKGDLLATRAPIATKRDALINEIAALNEQIAVYDEELKLHQ